MDIELLGLKLLAYVTQEATGANQKVDGNQGRKEGKLLLLCVL